MGGVGTHGSLNGKSESFSSAQTLRFRDRFSRLGISWSV